MANNYEQLLDRWKGDFGNSYIQRHLNNEETINHREKTFKDIFALLSDNPPNSILECGANIGLNLRAISRISDAKLFAIEPNGLACSHLSNSGLTPAPTILQNTVDQISLDDQSIDLVYTLTLLIHIPEEYLARACAEIYRVSKRNILCIEYFNPYPQTIKYRGHNDMLFKRDYGSYWMDNYPNLELLGNGFLWNRTTGMGDVNWWLFKKD